jgi:CBS domain-containing protein
MQSKDCGILPIVNSQAFLVGVITDRDIACRAVAEHKDTSEAVQDFMSYPPIVVRPESLLKDAC